MTSQISNIYRKIHLWKKLIWDGETDYVVRLIDKIFYSLNGFTTNEIVWYNFKKNDYKQYISEYERLISREINGSYKYILDDKLVFEEIFSNYVRVPENYAWISDGIVYGLHNNAIRNDNIFEFMINKRKNILKWINRGGGKGTYLLEFNDDIITINGNITTKIEIENLINRKGDAILCEFIEQSEFSASLYPHTSNTIRMVCAKKKNEQRVQLISAVQRIGRECSIPVDNTHSGGLVSEIDIDTGELSVAIAYLGEMSGRLIPYTTHPDSGGNINGRIIPDWEKLKCKVICLTNKFPFLNFVGWDILLTPDGFCIIEGNASSGCDLSQMKHGIRNDTLGDIYRSYNIIK